MTTVGASGSVEEARARLLGPNDPAPCQAINLAGQASFLLVADHAGARIPQRLGDMGVSAEDRGRHIALDLGIAGLAEALARRLDAAAFVQTYSRLVIDCNRAPERADAVPEISDGSFIPANHGLTKPERAARVREIHAPYHAAIAAELARRDHAGRPPIMVALHSFTPALSAGDADAPVRPWHAGVLYGGGDETYSHAVLRELRSRISAPVGDNQPYAMNGIDYTIPHHCFAAGRRYVEFEIRQDLLIAPGGAESWAALLAEALVAALRH